jgi:phosphate transport system permease protein
MTEQVAIEPFRSAGATPDLRKSWSERRALRSLILTSGAWIVALIASVPLFSVLYMLIVQGGSRLSLDLFTELPPAGFELGGGFGNAIVGTLVMVAIASPESRLASTARFLAKVLTGFPSILAGVFVYAILVLAMGTYSAWAGGISLAVLMLPTVVLTAEEAMKTVPRRMKDAALGMGCTRTQMIWKPDDLENSIADRSARDPDRRHAGRRAGRR